MPYLSASAVVIHYEEALYQMYAPLPYNQPVVAELLLLGRGTFWEWLEQYSFLLARGCSCHQTSSVNALSGRLHLWIIMLIQYVLFSLPEDVID